MVSLLCVYRQAAFRKKSQVHMYLLRLRLLKRFKKEVHMPRNRPT